MALDELTSLLHRWQAAGNVMDRARVVGEAGRLLRGLSVDERRELGRALAEGGVDHLAGQLDPHLPSPPAWEQTRPPAEQLLDLDARTGRDLLTRLDAVTADPPPPPPAASEPLPQPDPTPLPAPEPLPEPEPLPSPEPLPEPEPLPSPEPPPEPEPFPAPEPLRRPEPAPDPTPVPAASHAEARLRAVDELAAAADGPDAVLALLRRFPDGWQRRRAALRLLTDGLLDRLDPVDLLRLFAREGDRTRVAAALVGDGAVDVARLAGLLPDGSIRRLSRRAARALR